MIRDNVRPLIRRLSVLRTEARNIIRTLCDFEKADGMLTDAAALTDTQEAAVMADVQAKATGVATAYNTAVDVFTATEPVDPPEPDPEE